MKLPYYVLHCATGDSRFASRAISALFVLLNATCSTQCCFFSLLNFIHQKAWFEMFSRFIRSQTYRISFLFLHISHAMHRNFRNWHQLFYKRSSSCKIRALPLFNVFLVYHFYGDIDYLENHI